MYKTLIKSDHGKLFRGHAMNLIQGEHELMLHQNYFSTSVREVYSTKTNTTTIDYTHYPISWKIPKWYMNFHDNLVSLKLPTKLEAEDEGYSLNLYAGNVILFSYKKEKKGISFNSHIQNLKKIKELQQMFRGIRLVIKGFTDQDLKSFEIYEDPFDKKIIIPKDIFYK